MQILSVNSTTWLLSGLLAHWVSKVLYSQSTRKLSLAPGVGLPDFSSPGTRSDLVCRNTLGSYRRDCPPGYGLDLASPDGLNPVSVTLWLVITFVMQMGLLTHCYNSFL